jgi:hypothetical protein
LRAKVSSLLRSQQATDQTGAVFIHFVCVVSGKAVEAADLGTFIAPRKNDEGLSADGAPEQVRVLSAHDRYLRSSVIAFNNRQARPSVAASSAISEALTFDR